MTLTTVAEHLTLELPLPVSTVLDCLDRNSNTRPSVCEAYMYALTNATCLTKVMVIGYYTRLLQQVIMCPGVKEGIDMSLESNDRCRENCM